MPMLGFISFNVISGNLAYKAKTQISLTIQLSIQETSLYCKSDITEERMNNLT